MFNFLDNFAIAFWVYCVERFHLEIYILLPKFKANKMKKAKRQKTDKNDKNVNKQADIDPDFADLLEGTDGQQVLDEPIKQRPVEKKTKKTAKVSEKKVDKKESEKAKPEKKRGRKPDTTEFAEGEEQIVNNLLSAGNVRNLKDLLIGLDDVLGYQHLTKRGVVQAYMNKWEKQIEKIARKVSAAPEKQKANQQESAELFSYKGKLYKEGAIIAIGTKPAIVDLKSGSIAEDDEEEVDDGERNLQEEKEGKEFNEYQGEENLEESGVESEEEDDEIIPIVPKHLKKLAEIDVKYVSKPIFTRQVDIEILQDAGINAKALKRFEHVAFPVLRGNPTKKLQYAAYDYYIVTRVHNKKTGTSELSLQQYDPRITDRTVKILDLDVYPPPIPSKYNPQANVKELARPLLNMYEGNIGVGDYVSFVQMIRGQPIELEGLVSGFGYEGFVVLPYESDLTIAAGINLNTRFTIPFDDETLVRIDKPKISEKPNVLADFEFDEKLLSNILNSVVSEVIRDVVVKSLFQSISVLLPNVYASEMPYIPTDNINWSLISQPLKSWDEYYAEQFKASLLSDMYPVIFSQAPDLEQEAMAVARERAIEKNAQFDEGYAQYLVQSLMTTFGPFIFDGNGKDLLEIMLEYFETLEDINGTSEDLYMYIAKSAEGGNFIYLEGQELAIALADIITQYVLTTFLSADTEEIQQELRQTWTVEAFDRYVPTEKDRTDFNDRFLVSLQELYKEYHNNWSESFELSQIYKEQVNRISRVKLVHGSTSTFEGRSLTGKGVELNNKVLELESSIYLQVGTRGNDVVKTTTQDYLSVVVPLLMFLNPMDNVGRYATSFRAKIHNGVYKVNELYKLTNIDIFPEFYANSIQSGGKLTEREMEIARSELQKEIYNKTVNFIDDAIVQFGSARNLHKTLGSFPWNKYTSSTIASCGSAKRLQKLVFDGLDTWYNYDCRNVGDGVECVAKTEPIPEDDSIISFDEQSGKFTCNSLNDVMYALRDFRQDKVPTNFVTGQPFDSDFMARMDKRYGDMIDTWNFMPRNVMSFVTTKEELANRKTQAAKSNSATQIAEQNKPQTKPKISPVKKVKQKVLKQVTIDERSEFERIEGARNNLGRGQQLVVVFKNKTIPLGEMSLAYDPFLKQKLINVIVVLPAPTKSDNSGWDRLLSELELPVDKGAPLWLVVSKDNEKRTVYNRDLKGVTWGKALQNLLQSSQDVSANPSKAKKVVKKTVAKKPKSPAKLATKETVTSDTVDIFDFASFKEEHELMKQYYSDLELMLRTALLIDYKYNHLALDGRKAFDDKLESKKTKQAKKEFLDLVFDVSEPLYLVTQWYRHFLPSKLENPDFVENLLETHKVHLSGMFNKMYRGRIDKNWPLDTRLWFDGDYKAANYPKSEKTQSTKSPSPNKTKSPSPNKTKSPSPNKTKSPIVQPIVQPTAKYIPPSRRNIVKDVQPKESTKTTSTKHASPVKFHTRVADINWGADDEEIEKAMKTKGIKLVKNDTEKTFDLKKGFFTRGDPPTIKTKGYVVYDKPIQINLSYYGDTKEDVEDIQISKEITFHVGDEDNGPYLTSTTNRYTVDDLAKGIYYAYKAQEEFEDLIVNGIKFSNGTITDDSDH